MISSFRNIKGRWVESRRGLRKPCSIIVQYEIRGKSHRDYIKDISPYGAFIETITPCRIGDVIHLTIPISPKHRPIMVQGRITRVTSIGVGVEFKHKINAPTA